MYTKYTSSASWRKEPSRVDEATYFPKPLDNNVVGGVAALVPGVLPPVVHVHVPQTTHEQLSGTIGHVNHLDGPPAELRPGKTHLQLILIKNLDQIQWNQLKESLNIENICTEAFSRG